MFAQLLCENIYFALTSNEYTVLSMCVCPLPVRSLSQK